MVFFHRPGAIRPEDNFSACGHGQEWRFASWQCLSLQRGKGTPWLEVEEWRFASWFGQKMATNDPCMPDDRADPAAKQGGNPLHEVCAA